MSSERKKPRVELISLNPFTVRSMQIEADRLAQYETATHEANALQAVLRALHGVVADLPQTQARTEVLKWIGDTTTKWSKAADQSRKLAEPVQTREVVQAVMHEFCQKNPEVGWDRTALIPSEAKCAELVGKPGLLGPAASDFLSHLHTHLHEFDPALAKPPPLPFNRTLDLTGADAEHLAQKYGERVVEKLKASLPWQVCFRRPDTKKSKLAEPDGRLVEVAVSPTRHALEFHFVYVSTMERCSFERYQTLARQNPLPSRDPSDLTNDPLSLFVRRKPEHEWMRMSSAIDPSVAGFKDEESLEYFIGHG